ncbi:HAMP domain-containing histidine kinase [Nordella sp. HKS 07]|uniref:sensor histidine kinase n=1 Tax=Nordella sp. HKS 07 TaxID=2712222 RepID=UPI0013E0F824|nr:HAMP domain-containing sensor histidine kinase [Nordella sp. HKS 07]QIG49659.1 HAMP domain-containing histidine kinase [Nordella sp. HKS 07]
MSPSSQTSNHSSYWKLFHTSTFRLSAVYLIVFIVSVGAILAYIYWNTAGLLERQTDETIRAEVQGLADQYRIRGLDGVLDTVRRRSSDDSGSIYLLTTPEGVRMAGNLISVPDEIAIEDSGWTEFPFNVKTSTGMEPHRARVYYTELPGENVLVVGRDIEDMRQFATIIRNTLITGTLIAVALGIGGGLLTSRNFLRRVDAITDASRSIMQGDLAGRMPVQGTGDELDRLAESLNRMLDQIERLMRGMQEVSSNVAHDLRTPLTRIKARAESALRSGAEGDFKAALEQTIDESDRLLQTFAALLSIAKAESGQSREGLQPVDAAVILHEVAELYEPFAEDQGGNLTTEIAEALDVRANRQLLAQAISNLVDNALKYGESPETGVPEIRVTGGLEGDDAVITVSDRGRGVAPEDRLHVLERFVRLDESRSKPGNGLGLSLVAGVMKLHDGRIVLEDNEPGLRVKLVLPQLQPA